MTTRDKIARRKLSLLELASEMNNVSKACRIMGYSRQLFYEIRRNFQTYGAQGLLDRLPGPRGPHPNRVAAEVEEAILAHAMEHPCPGGATGRAGASPEGHPGVGRRRARGVAAQWTTDQA